MKRILMIAYHFPPLAGSSGIQRTLRFVQQLPDFGWEPIVLTVHPRAYEQVSDDLLQEVPVNLVVHRAFALDAARHLSIARHYPSFLARPDRWLTWWLGALLVGLAIVRKFQPQILWSTFPIATAHCIGASLAQLTGLPWIADFRDPMAHDGYPPERRLWRSVARVERKVFVRAAHVVTTTEGCARFYRMRYPTKASHISVIENGYDEEVFTKVEQQIERKALNPGMITLLHSGTVYPEERDPSCLFNALALLSRAGKLSPKQFRLRFRAAVHDKLLHAMATRFGIQDFVELLPPISYCEAIAEMFRSDGLLILQASSCNDQIPAKLYEYLRTRRPILTLADPNGETAAAAHFFSYRNFAALSDTGAIADALERFLAQIVTQDLALPDDCTVNKASYVARTTLLARLLDKLAG